MNNTVYEPDEDTFLLWDTFKSELETSLDINLSILSDQKILKKYSLLDMGCGSGYLGLEARKLGFEKITLADKNTESITYVKNILESEDLNLTLIQSDLFENISSKFDFILFNTPYLPDEDDSSLNDIALNGGPNGNEVALHFIEDLDNYLSSEGFALILVSSLSNPDVIEKKLIKKNFLFRIVARKKLFFEELLVYKITKSSENKFNISTSDLLLLKNKIPSVYTDVELFSKGKRGVIFKAKRNNHDLVIKLSLINSDSQNTSLLEGRYLDKVNQWNIGPKLVEYNDYFVAMEFLDGVLIGDYLESKNWSRDELISVLKNLFSQLIILDSNKINKFEMTNPYKHIIICKSRDFSSRSESDLFPEPVLLDFERARFVRRTKNVTQFAEYLLSKKILPILQEKSILSDVDSFKEKIKNYLLTSKLDLDNLF